jgi:hypothetical protein
MRAPLRAGERPDARHESPNFFRMNVMSLEIFNLRGSLALVTGSRQGIGLAIAQGLGAAGAELIINGRDQQKLAAANAIRGSGT